MVLWNIFVFFICWFDCLYWVWCFFNKYNIRKVINIKEIIFVILVLIIVVVFFFDLGDGEIEVVIVGFRVLLIDVVIDVGEIVVVVFDILWVNGGVFVFFVFLVFFIFVMK